MQKILALIICVILALNARFVCGTISGFDADVVCVNIAGDEYGFYGDGYEQDEEVVLFMIADRVEGVWKK